MPEAAEVAMQGELFRSSRFPDVKDPSAVFDGRRWHVFATGCGRPGGLQVLHASAPRLDGPWREHRPARLIGVEHIEMPAAPGVVAEGRRLHMFLQHSFNRLGGSIDHLTSEDGGATFTFSGTALTAGDGGEAGVYDPDPARVQGEVLLTYAGMSVVGQPDLYLARSPSGAWAGPWERLGCILRHGDVPGHNQVGDEGYEWGLEGPQLLELPDGRCLLTAVAFTSGWPAGSRQRLILAVADGPAGPYEVLGPVVEPAGGGENGHGTAVLHELGVDLIYQERAGPGHHWQVLRASVDGPWSEALPARSVS